MAEQQIQTPPQSAEHTMARPQRWAQPFDSNMTDQDVDRLLSESQLKDIDGEKFRKHIPLDAKWIGLRTHLYAMTQIVHSSQVASHIVFSNRSER